MDNDDNDYHGQGLHLVGEESSKVSSVLHPYALPKFDFDEGHLRFDSLVENEVFLGIPSQEDNQWIEDFSRGSSRINFSSSAADSCSIPRHNNVWSEATSSESVEMLLKSVGQEEMVPGESDTGDELPSLTEQMDDKIDNLKDSNSELPPVDGGGKYSGLNKNQEAEDALGRCISQVQEVDLSSYGYSGAINEESKICVTEENMPFDMKSFDENQREVCMSVNESLSDKMQEDPSVTGVEVQDAQCLSEDVPPIVEKTNDHVMASDVYHESADNLADHIIVHQSAQDNNSVVEDEILSKISNETCANDLHSSIQVESKVVTMEKFEAEVTIQEPSGFPPVGNSDLLTEEGNNEEGRSLETSQGSSSTVLAFSEGMEIRLQFESRRMLLEKSSVANQSGDGHINECPMELSNSDTHVICSEHKEPDMLISRRQGCSADTEDDNLGSTGQIGTGSSDIQMEAPISSGMQIESPEQGGHVSEHGDDLALLKQRSTSVGDDCVVIADGSKDGSDVAGIDKEESSAADHVSAPKQAGSADKCKEVQSLELDDDVNECAQSFGICEKAAEEMTSNLGKIEHGPVGSFDDGKMIGSSSLGEVGEENDETAHGSEFDVSGRNEKEPNLKVESTDKVASDTVESIPSLHAAVGEVVIHNVEHKSHQSEEEREVQMEAPTDVTKSALQLSGDEPFQQCPDSDSKRVASDVSPSVVVLEDANESANVVVVETSDAAINTEQVVADKASVELSAEACSVHCDPNAKEGEGAKALGTQDNEEPPREQNHLATPSDLGGNISVEVEKPDTISDTVVGGSDLSRSEMDKQAGAKGSTGQNLAVSVSKGGVGDKDSSNPVPSGVSVASEEEKSFTFDVSPLADLPEGGTSKGWQSVPHIQAHESFIVVDASPSMSVTRKIDPKAGEEISHRSQQTPEKGAPFGRAKGPSERKPRRVSAKSGKENARKGNSVKETVPFRQSERGDRLAGSVGSSGTGPLMHLEAGSVERSGAKPGPVLSVSGSSLPDLNTSALSPLLFQQPFTDLQQVQLRAQIFVYGSLIQGVAPDEACMVSAFGISDGGRSFWEPAWRVYLERLHCKKSHPISTETPLQSRLGAKASDQTNTQSIKVPSTPPGRVSSKSTPSPVVNPTIALSSPLWNISTTSCDALPTNLVRGPFFDYQALSPLHAYQTPTIRNFAGHTNSWPSQGPFPGSWVSSAQSPAVDARFSALPVADTLKLTPIKESSMPISSTTKHAPPNPIAQGGSSIVFSGGAVSHTQHSSDPKSRKRKKTFVSEDPGQVAMPVTLTGSVSSPVANSDASRKVHVVEDLSQGVLTARSHTELASAPALTSHFSTSVSIATPSNLVFKNGSDKSHIAVSPVSSIDHTKGGVSPLDKRLLKPEDVAKVEEAKIQAEEAAAHAAVAVSKCQNVWSQLDKQKNSGLMSDFEAKLASAAVSIAAAASIAKAAAAAAKIASNVAVQAKLMADEASISNGTQNPMANEFQSLPGFANNLGNATPASILKVGDGNNNSSSIIFAAREAARRKTEAASAASKHAENLEAIVKAAELAAEAVSQAGKVVAMGDPLPMSDLVEAGLEGYWKGSKLNSGQGVKSNCTMGNKTNIKSVEEVTDLSMEQSERPSDKEAHTRNLVTSSSPKATSRNTVDDHKKGEDGISASVTRGEKDLRGQKNRRASNSSKAIGVIPESEMASRYTAYENIAGPLNDSGGIKENCLVEVFKDNGDFTGAWFSANVLSLKGEKALVCYTDLESNEESGKLKEWVSLEAEHSKSPRIRLAHPMTSITFEGTRKRRRAAVRDYAWSHGDRVDAWIENGWREGIIIEKNKKDETTLSIHFPAQGKTSVVRAWHLRPTLVWKDGEWIEWSNFKESLQGDTPQEKRPKLGSPLVEGKRKGTISKDMDLAESGKSEEPKVLPLSVNEKIFSIGSTRNESIPENRRTMRSGLQKEGSKVIFGVPKPGKKRKFMEVSKHYVSDRSIKNNDPNDREKFAKYTMPQGSGSRGWKNNSKIDSKEKPAADSNKPKSFKSGKPPSLSTRTLPQKDNSLILSESVSKDANLSDNMPKDPTSNNDNDSGQQNLSEFVSSNIEEAAEEHLSFSSQAPPSDARRKAATLNAKSERLKKGNLAPARGRLAKVEVKDKSIPEAVEPRRSNRRIQPTSRLLEGLQSSLIISKIPSVSHDKNYRSHNRGGI